MLKETDKQEVRRIAKRHRSAPKIVNATSVPTRGDTDAYGNPFDGFPGNRLAVNSITGVEIAPDEVDTPHLKDDSVKRGQILNGEIIEVKLASEAVTSGKLKSNNHGVNPLDTPNVNDDTLRAVGSAHIKTKAIDYYHLADGAVGNRVLAMGLGGISGKLPAHKISGKIPKHNISGVDWDQVDDKPPLATKHYVDNAIDDLWKRALNKFQKKP